MNQGTLNDGEVVAIKKTTMASRGRKAYFDSELKIISNVHHRHLMRLLGYCNKGPHLFLVLEFMENGSLDKFLYGDLGPCLQIISTQTSKTDIRSDNLQVIKEGA